MTTFTIRGKRGFPAYFHDNRLCHCVFCDSVFIVRADDAVTTDAGFQYFQCPECDNGVGIGATWLLVKDLAAQ